jgi:hypothetical protein
MEGVASTTFSSPARPRDLSLSGNASAACMAVGCSPTTRRSSDLSGDVSCSRARNATSRATT